jgi:hypothetical protein
VRHCLAFVAVVAAVVVAVVAFAAEAAVAVPMSASSPTSAQRWPHLEYRPPVDAPITERFRPPSTPYGPGNRGVDYATTVGQPVVAAAEGEVVFAGQVGGRLHVVVLHADGLRTTYAFLDTVDVHRGDRVVAGAVVGRASAIGLHFGVRRGDAYLDPLALFDNRRGHPWLVPDDDTPAARTAAAGGRDPPAPPATATAVPSGAAAAAWFRRFAAGQVARRAAIARVLAQDVISLGLPPAVALAVAASGWQADQANCTPASEPVPRSPPGGQRRIAVLVGGLGSATGHAAVLDVDTKTLGYAPGDVHQFSYREGGGAYTADDTHIDITVAARRLAARLRELAAANPGVPVDVIAHSQGGLVARAAMGDGSGWPAGGLPATVVTLGTPHDGTDVATLVAALGEPLPVSVEQMTERSGFLRALASAKWPSTTHVVSIAARGDPVVPNVRSVLGPEDGDDVANAVVTPYAVTSIFDHSKLPGSPEATAEIARAIARQPPTCRGLADHLVDWAYSQRTAMAADTTGALVAVALLAMPWH